MNWILFLTLRVAPQSPSAASSLQMTFGTRFQELEFCLAVLTAMLLCLLHGCGMSCVIHESSSDGLYNPIKALVSILQLTQQTKGCIWSLRLSVAE